MVMIGQAVSQTVGWRDCSKQAWREAWKRRIHCAAMCVQAGELSGEDYRFKFTCQQRDGGKRLDFRLQMEFQGDEDDEGDGQDPKPEHPRRTIDFTYDIDVSFCASVLLVIFGVAHPITFAFRKGQSWGLRMQGISRGTP